MLENLIAEKTRRKKNKLREFIQEAKQRNMLTPNVVAAYAYVHLSNDNGIPLQPAAHHWLWLNLLCDTNIKKLLIIGPPESAKTTWAVSAYLGCKIGFYPEQSFILGSSSGPIASKRSLSLRTMTQSSEWQATFPNILRANGMLWDSKEWSIAPDGQPTDGRLHPTVAAYGTGGSIIGSRAGEMLADDLLDFNNTRTQHQRDLVKEWFHNSFLSRRKSGIGRVIIIGTAWHPGDIYSITRREQGWVVCHIPLLSETNEVRATLTYPDNWPYPMLGEPIANAVLPTSQ